MQQMAQDGFKPGVAVVRTQSQYVIHALPGELTVPSDLAYLTEKKKYYILNADAFGLSGGLSDRDVSHIKVESKPQHLEFYLEGVLWCMFPPLSLMLFVSLYCQGKAVLRRGAGERRGEKRRRGGEEMERRKRRGEVSM